MSLNKNQEARFMMLRDVMSLLGSAYPDGRSGIALASLSNSFVDDATKYRIKHEFSLFMDQIGRRIDKLDREMMNNDA